MNYYIVAGSTEYNQSIDITCPTLQGEHRCVDDVADADIIVPVGGDGTMLHTIWKYGELKKPFVGINAGTRGFLLNTLNADENMSDLVSEPLNYIDLWLIEGKGVSESGDFQVFGFNDIWVERFGGQTLRMYLNIDNRPRTDMIVGDGMLFSTPQGSTGYNLALRGKPILPEVPVLQVTPIAAVMNKNPMRSIILSDNSKISLSFDQIDKRPSRVFVDGKLQEISGLSELHVRKSNKKVTLGFRKDKDIVSKMSAWQIA